MPTAQQAGFMRAPSLGAGAAAMVAAVLSSLRRATSASSRGFGRGKAPSSLAVGSCCGARLALARREFVVLSSAREQMLVCKTGELWVTLESDSTDYILKHGERLAVPAHARAIVTAAATSVVGVAASPRGPGGEVRNNVPQRADLLWPHIARDPAPGAGSR